MQNGTFDRLPGAGDNLKGKTPYHQICGVLNRHTADAGHKAGFASGNCVPAPSGWGGFKPGDRVRSINGNLVESWSDFTQIVGSNAGNELLVVLEREGDQVDVLVTPETVQRGANKYGKVGVTVDLSEVWATETYGFISAGKLAFEIVPTL